MTSATATGSVGVGQDVGAGVARSAAGADTMSDFLKEYHKRYPGYSSAVRPPPAEPQPTPTGDPSASNAGARPGQG